MREFGKISTKRSRLLFATSAANTAMQLIWSLEISIRAAKGERIDEPEDFDKKMTLLKRKLGENPDVNIELKYNNESIQKVLADVLIPIMQEWEKKLKAFEPLFQFHTYRVSLFKSDNGLLLTLLKLVARRVKPLSVSLHQELA